MTDLDKKQMQKLAHYPADIPRWRCRECGVWVIAGKPDHFLCGLCGGEMKEVMEYEHHIRDKGESPGV